MSSSVSFKSSGEDVDIGHGNLVLPCKDRKNWKETWKSAPAFILSFRMMPKITIRFQVVMKHLLFRCLA
jgi:hypothetical protein